MANRKAKIKTISINSVRRSRNRAMKSILHSQAKKLDEAIEAGDVDKANAELKVSILRLDKGVTKGLMHKKNASRKKSRLCARVSKMA
jgi:small subunit ribosomal protein S20